MPPARPAASPSDPGGPLRPGRAFPDRPRKSATGPAPFPRSGPPTAPPCSPGPPAAPGRLSARRTAPPAPPEREPCGRDGRRPSAGRQPPAAPAASAAASPPRPAHRQPQRLSGPARAWPASADSAPPHIERPPARRPGRPPAPPYGWRAPAPAAWPVLFLSESPPKSGPTCRCWPGPSIWSAYHRTSCSLSVYYSSQSTGLQVRPAGCLLETSAQNWRKHFHYWTIS